MKKSPFGSSVQSNVLLIAFLFMNVICFGQKLSEKNSEQTVQRSFEDPNLQWGPAPEFMPAGTSISILHGDPSKPNLDILFKAEPNTDLPGHWHTSAERMILISGEMQVTYEGEPMKVLKKGDYLYGPSNKTHTARCVDQGPCVLFIAFEEPLDAFEAKVENVKKY